MTIFVSGNFRIATTEVVQVTDPIGFSLTTESSGSVPMAFNNAGTVTVISENTGIVAGVNFVSGAFYNTTFTNEATGVFRVTTTRTGNTTYGVTANLGTGGLMGDVVNAGLFEVSATSQAVGVFTADQNFSFENSGTFRVSSSAHDAWGVWASNGSTVLNTNLIEVSGRSATGVLLERATSLNNSGTIRSLSSAASGGSIAVNVRGFTQDSCVIANSGVIEGLIAIFDDSNPTQLAVQRLQNTGTIRGIVDLRYGADELINAGLVDGEVRLGHGADLYDGRGGTQIGGVYGGFGSDRLIGGDSADVLLGEDGDDHISGGAGSDFLNGGRGNDVIEGGDGEDTLSYVGIALGVVLDLETETASAAGIDRITGIENVYGTDFADSLRGHSTSNLLYGADGSDILDGRGGDDTLVGGRDADQLTGGAGADAFIFGAGDGVDSITDFDPAQDQLRVFGYTSYIELRQAATGTLVVLSATDSILLVGVNLASVSASNLIFSSAPRTDYGSPTRSPNYLGAETVDFREAAHIYLGETVRLESPTSGLNLYRGTPVAAPALTNAGTIISTGSTGLGAVGLTVSGFMSSDAFINEGSGTVSVSSSVRDATSTGVVSSALGGRIVNLGQVDVRSAGPADGVRFTGFGGDTINGGTISVNAAGQAYGIRGSGFNNLTNTGIITVVGSGSAVGFMTSQSGTVTNTGTIAVSNLTGQSFGIQASFNSITIRNSGLIVADTTIHASVGLALQSSLVENTGELRGNVVLGSGGGGGFLGGPVGVLTVLNSGLITGRVELGHGGDVYDGTEGVQLQEVFGGGGNDTLFGGRGVDQLNGGTGADILRGGAGGDFINGGDGLDTATYATSTAAVQVDIESNQARGGDAEGDTLVSIENLVGSSFADVLVGNDNTNNIQAGAGNDHLFGGDGDDLLTGGLGNDTINGGWGDDVVIVQGSRDDYRVFYFNDFVYIKGPDGGDRLTNVETIRFSGGGTIELNRLEAQSEKPQICTDEIEEIEPLFTPVETFRPDIPPSICRDGLDGTPYRLTTAQGHDHGREFSDWHFD